jgi:hypothetical protein
LISYITFSAMVLRPLIWLLIVLQFTNLIIIPKFRRYAAKHGAFVTCSTHTHTHTKAPDMFVYDTYFTRASNSGLSVLWSYY